MSSQLPSKKKLAKKTPAELSEFWLVAGADSTIDDIKDTCTLYASEDDALADAAAATSAPYDGTDGDRFPYVVFRVQRFWKVSP